MRLPDVYIAGAQKSGTTTLYDWLAQHPQIYAHHSAKDYPIFSSSETFRHGRKEFYGFLKNAPFDAVTLGGDANAMYAPEGPRRMHDILPNARIVVILREPVDRAFSAYCYAYGRLIESRTFEDAIIDELNGHSYSEEEALQKDYIEHGRYCKQLQRILSYYNRKNLFIILFDDIIQRPRHVFRELCRWIGVDENAEVKFFARNRTRFPRSRLLVKLSMMKSKNPLMRGVKTVVPFPLRVRMRHLLYEYGTRVGGKPPFPAKTRGILRDIYRQEVDELESFVSRDLSAWR